MKKQYIATAFFCILAVVGCKQEESHSEPKPEQVYVPLKVNVKVGEISPKASSRAGAITESAFGEGVRIGVVLVDKDPAIATPRYGTTAPYLCVGDYTNADAPTFSWQALDADNPLLVNLSPALARAHYPAVLPSYAALSSDKRSLSIELPETMAYGSYSDYNGMNISMLELKSGEPMVPIYFTDDNIDFMTGAGAQELTAINDVVQTDITMKHTMAMIVIRLTSPSGAPTEYDMINEISLENISQAGGPLVNGSFSLADNSFTPAADKPVRYHRPMSGFSQGTYFGILAFPASFAENQVAVISKVGSVKYTFILPVTTWVSGSVYLYDINLKSAEGVLGQPIVIKDWVDRTEDVELE